MLLDHYRELGGQAWFSTELVSFAQAADGVLATVRDRVTGESRTIRAGYLVGADGHRSAVRAQLGIAMEGPPDLGQFFSMLFRADLSDVLGEKRYGLYALEGDGPPRVLVPSGTDDRYVHAIPLPPGIDDATVAAMFPPERCVALIREVTGRPELEVELLATAAFAFSAQVAERWRDGRVFLVGDAAHRMTPRGGRGMNTAIADAFDLSWKLAFVARGIADPALLDSYEAERGPIGRRNVAMSMAPAGGGSDDGLAEDLGSLVASAAIAFPPDGRPGSRAPHAWLDVAGVADLDARPVRARVRAADRRVRRGVANGRELPRDRRARPVARRPSRASRRRPGRGVRLGVRPRGRRRGPRPARRGRRLADGRPARRSRSRAHRRQSSPRWVQRGSIGH